MGDIKTNLETLKDAANRAGTSVWRRYGVPVLILLAVGAVVFLTGWLLGG